MKYKIMIDVDENILRCDTSYGIYKDENLITEKINSLKDEGITMLKIERIDNNE